MSDRAGEKTEQATPRRLEEAHKKGQVTRSRELNTLASLLGSAVGMMLFGPNLTNGWSFVLSVLAAAGLLSA